MRKQNLILVVLAVSFVVTGCETQLTTELDPQLTTSNADTSEQPDLSDSDDNETPPATPAADLDGDGYTADVDCNDSPDDADNDGKIDGFFVNPGAPEICDGVDNNCDGVVDEGVTLTVFRDADQDGYGSDVEGDSQQICQDADVPEGYVTQNGDCNDVFSDDDADGHVDGYFTNPSVPESADNGVDDNCNGEVDEVNDEPGEFANAMSVTLTQTVASAELTAQVYHKHSDLGAWWNPEQTNSIVESNSKTVTVQFTDDNDVASACGIRFNVTITDSAGAKSWLCEGNGSSAAINWAHMAHTSLTIGNVTYDTAELTNSLETWSDETGSGCSLLIVLDESGDCASPVN